MLRVLLLTFSLMLTLSQIAAAGDDAKPAAPAPAPKPADKPAAKPAKPPKPPVTCQAQDEKGAVLATATDATTTLCRRQVTEAMKKATCDGTKTNLKYMFVAKEGAKPTKAFIFCPKKLVVPPAPGPCTPDKPGCPPPAATK